MLDSDEERNWKRLIYSSNYAFVVELVTIIPKLIYILSEIVVESVWIAKINIDSIVTVKGYVPGFFSFHNYCIKELLLVSVSVIKVQTNLIS